MLIASASECTVARIGDFRNPVFLPREVFQPPSRLNVVQTILTALPSTARTKLRASGQQDNLCVPRGCILGGIYLQGLGGDDRSALSAMIMMMTSKVLTRTHKGGLARAKPVVKIRGDLEILIYFRKEAVKGSIVMKKTRINH